MTGLLCATCRAAAACASGLALGCTAAAQQRDEAHRDPPVFTRREVAAHRTKATGVWMTHGRDVYDVTRFVDSHPGGASKIMLAAGQAVEPYWRIYQTHRTSRLVQERLLPSMRIGRLAPSEAPPEDAGGAEDDPYAGDPPRSAALVVHSDRPCNAECPAALQTARYLTPNELFFVRNHHPVPPGGEAVSRAWTVRLAGPGVRSDARAGGGTSWTLPQLRDTAVFARHEVTATLQCGGNRRAEHNAVEETAGTPWGAGAASTARWGGVRLRDVLRAAGLGSVRDAERAGARHIVFTGADGLRASIPVEKALDECGDVLLAFEMNGEPLPRDHGFPLRVVVPGHVGVRNVKWLTSITASREEAEGPWQRGISYKGFPPQVKSFERVDVASVLSMQEMPVQSIITEPRHGDHVRRNAGIDGDGDGDDDDTLAVRGWAWSGGGRGIARVDVSADGGRSWQATDLEEGRDQHPGRAWAWTFWEAEVRLPPPGQPVELCCRATDAAYNVQPERVAPFWNKRGLYNNAWHRVPLADETREGDDGEGDEVGIHHPMSFSLHDLMT